MRYYLVDTSSVTCEIPNTFDINQLTAAAEAINELGMLAYPVVAKQTGIQSFQVIGNEFYYYAVLRAIELGGSQSSMSAMVVEDDKYMFASAQRKASTRTQQQEADIALKQQRNLASVTHTGPTPATVTDAEMEAIAHAADTQNVTVSEADMERIAYIADMRRMEVADTARKATRTVTPTVRKYKTREEEIKAKLALK